MAYATCFAHSVLTYYRSRMFNTGDIARWREDGSLDMLGREDDQVKIKVGALLKRSSTTDFDRVSASNSMESPVSLRYKAVISCALYQGADRTSHSRT